MFLRVARIEYFRFIAHRTVAQKFSKTINSVKNKQNSEIVTISTPSTIADLVESENKYFHSKDLSLQSMGRQTFSAVSVNILGFGGHVVTVGSTQPHCGSREAATWTHNM